MSIERVCPDMSAPHASLPMCAIPQGRSLEIVAVDAASARRRARLLVSLNHYDGARICAADLALLTEGSAPGARRQIARQLRTLQEQGLVLKGCKGSLALTAAGIDLAVCLEHLQNLREAIGLAHVRQFVLASQGHTASVCWTQRRGCYALCVNGEQAVYPTEQAARLLEAAGLHPVASYAHGARVNTVYGTQVRAALGAKED